MRGIKYTYLFIWKEHNVSQILNILLYALSAQRKGFSCNYAMSSFEEEFMERFDRLRSV